MTLRSNKKAAVSTFCNVKTAALIFCCTKGVGLNVKPSYGDEDEYNDAEDEPEDGEDSE